MELFNCDICFDTGIIQIGYLSGMSCDCKRKQNTRRIYFSIRKMFFGLITAQEALTIARNSASLVDRLSQKAAQ